MALRDYLSYIADVGTKPLSVDTIPLGPELTRRRDELHTIIDEELDLGVLGEGQFVDLGPAASPDDMELFRLTTEMTLDVPVLMDWLKLPRTFVADAYHLDMRLVTVEVAADEISTMTGIGVRVTGAALTEANDHVEDVVTAITEDLTLSEDERTTVRLNCANPGRTRAWELTRRAARKARAERRKAQVNAQLQHLNEQVQAAQKLEALRHSAQPPQGGRSRRAATKSPARRRRAQKLDS